MKKNIFTWPSWLGGNKETIITFDYGGEKYARAINNEIITSRLNRFKYDNWPFNLQTEKELNMFLYIYGVVAYFESPINKELIFVPIVLSNHGDSKFNYLSKFNYQNWTFEFRLFGQYNNLTGSEEQSINKKIILKNNQFIFALTTQEIPEQIFDIAKTQLKDTMNAMVANKHNKLPLEIVKNKKLNKEIMSAIELRIITGDFTPVKYIEDQVEGKNQTIPEYARGILTPVAPDLYNSLSLEFKDWKNEMFVLNGVKQNELMFSKTSAQETQQQTQPKLLRALANYKNELNNQKEWFDNLNLVLNFDSTKKVSVSSNNNYFDWIKFSDLSLKIEQEKNKND